MNYYFKKDISLWTFKSTSATLWCLFSHSLMFAQYHHISVKPQTHCSPNDSGLLVRFQYFFKAILFPKEDLWNQSLLNTSDACWSTAHINIIIWISSFTSHWFSSIPTQKNRVPSNYKDREETQTQKNRGEYNALYINVEEYCGSCWELRSWAAPRATVQVEWIIMEEHQLFNASCHVKGIRQPCNHILQKQLNKSLRSLFAWIWYLYFVHSFSQSFSRHFQRHFRSTRTIYLQYYTLSHLYSLKTIFWILNQDYWNMFYKKILFQILHRISSSEQKINLPVCSDQLRKKLPLVIKSNER